MRRVRLVTLAIAAFARSRRLRGRRARDLHVRRRHVSGGHVHALERGAAWGPSSSARPAEVCTGGPRTSARSARAGP